MSQETVQIAQELARIARENDLAEIEYRGQEFRLRLTFEYPETTVVAAPPSAVAAAPAAAPAAPAPTPPPAVEERRFPTVESPLAGVFYRSPRPGSPAFVEAGQTVASGHTLCIVEAMKLMNEITAEGSMRIHKILVDNGTVVASGQALFEYEPL